MRWSVGKQISARGAGLGNEIFPWAKAYLGARALGLNLVEPAWRVNPRRYDREFQSGPVGSLKHFAARFGPHTAITQEMLRAADETDYYLAVRKLAVTTIDQRFPVLLHASGMTGGYLAIRRARRFLSKSILGAPQALQAAEQIDDSPGPAIRVGVHVRGGDFDAAGEVRKSVFNQSLPLEWYTAQIQSLREASILPLDVFLATDTPSLATTEALTLGNSRPRSIGTSSVSDLAILASCDILVSSISSFSMLAAFLSDAPYIWHRDQLGESGGWLSIWGHESGDAGGGPTLQSTRKSFADNARFGRGLAHGNDPKWSKPMLDFLISKAYMRNKHSDLIYYGVVSEKELSE